MTTRIKLRRDTAASWLLANPILAAGEPGLETDTGKVKYGDGVTAWADLRSLGGDKLVNDKAVTVTAGDDTKWLAVTKRDSSYWNNNWQGIGNVSVYYDHAGNIVTLGYIDQNNTYNMYVAKYTPAGVLVWKKSLNAVSGGFSAYVDGCMAIDAANNIIISLGFDDIGHGLLKLDANGEQVWCGLYQDNIGNVGIYGITVDSNNDIFITTGNAAPNGMMGVAKIANTTGNLLWSKQFGNSSDWQSGASIALDHFDNIYVTGHVETNGDEADAICVVVKMDAVGEVQWRKSLTMADHSVDRAYNYANGIDVDQLGNVYITGQYDVQNPTSMTDTNSRTSKAVYIVKLNTSGAVQWSRRAGPGSCDWTGLSTTIGSDGDLYLAAATYSGINAGNGDQASDEKGFFEYNLVLARYNPATGDVVWQKYFNNRHQQTYSGFYSSTRSIDVHADKLLICGTSQFAFDYGYGHDSDKWQTGWLAQLSTDGSVGFDLGDFTFIDSRVPGKKITVTTTDNTTLTVDAGSLEKVDNYNGIPTVDAPISSVTIRSKDHTWTFDTEGNTHTPAEGDLILDQTELGYINFMGYEDNYNDDIWFQSVVGDADGYTYALGANYWNTRRITVYKFDPVGTRVWGVELHSGSGAVFNVSKAGGVYTIDAMTNQGYNYRVGDTVVISGYDLGGEEPLNNLTILVTEVDSGNLSAYNGYITDYEIQSGIASTGTGFYESVEDYNDSGESRPESITIDPSTGNLVVVGQTYEYNGDNSIVYLVLDAESGAVLANKEIHDPGKDVYPYDVQVNSAGVSAIVGQEYGVTKTIVTLTPAGGSGLGTITQGKEGIAVADGNTTGTYPGYLDNGADWYISGTDIINQAYIIRYNAYLNIPLTPVAGSGANFDITADGAGGYTVVLGTSGGANYLQGHKIKVLGSALGGADSTNDAIITVSSVDSGVITGVTIEGTSTGSATTTGASGTNYNVGTGAVARLVFDPQTGAYQNYALYTNGDDYVIGDIITIPGTTFAGSTSPANDVSFTVTYTNNGYQAGSRGQIWSLSPNGSYSISPDYLSLEIENYSNYDFSGPGTWQLLESKDGEAFIWTPEFQKNFGGDGNDWFTSVAWQGTDTIFAAGASHNLDTDYDENILVKMSSTGTVAWKKQLTHSDYRYNSYIHGIGAHTDGVVAVGTASDWDEESDVGFIYKLDNAGNLMWHKNIRCYYNQPNYTTIAVDPATEDFIVAFNAYDNYSDTDAIFLFKFDRDGNIIWKRMLSSGMYDEFNNENGYRSVHIAGDRFFFAGYTWWAVNDYSNAFSASLPLDGTGLGEYGIWSYSDVTDQMVKTYDKTVINGGSTVVDHVLTSQAATTLAINNARYYYTDYPVWTFPIINEVVRNKSGGALVFPDGTKQTTSADISKQIRVAKNYTIRAEDAGGHIFVDSADTNYGQFTVYLPAWQFTNLPVGFKFTIINRSDHNVYIYNRYAGGATGEIYGVDGWGNYRNSNGWVMYGNNQGANWVELIKVKEGFNVTDNTQGDQWVIRGVPEQFGVD